jgi:hypothetical protein
MTLERSQLVKNGSVNKRKLILQVVADAAREFNAIPPIRGCEVKPSSVSMVKSTTSRSSLG